MSFLDFFAVFVLLILFVCAIGVWVLLGILPGRIARARKHPQADAITMCGWWGVLTMGLLLPLAFIWAYYDPLWRQKHNAGDSASLVKESPAP